ncbi:hypothetical protein T02_2505 [Trichinella nativa]|uniref:Uncharacterized protein n=1 Tax=Trichinella nativa TaxID=6335 RepID=A0A0V1LPF4_9BILA|nr:hypothetical protein T02_2505 [Trichinella nativa]
MIFTAVFKTFFKSSDINACHNTTAFTTHCPCTISRYTTTIPLVQLLRFYISVKSFKYFLTSTPNNWFTKQHNNVRSSSARFAIFETSVSLFCIVFVTTRVKDSL